MSVTDEVLDPLTVALDALNVTYLDRSATPRNAPVKAYKFAPRDLDGPGPWVVLEVPTIQRRGVDTAESQLGTRGFLYEIPCVVYVPLDDPYLAQAVLTAAVCAVIDLIDADVYGGDGTVLEATVTEVQPADVIEDAARPLMSQVCTVQLLKFVV